MKSQAWPALALTIVSGCFYNPAGSEFSSRGDATTETNASEQDSTFGTTGGVGSTASTGTTTGGTEALATTETTGGTEPLATTAETTTTTGGTEPLATTGTMTTGGNESTGTTGGGDETTGTTTGGDETTGTTTGGGGVPDAAALELSFSQVKQFDFSWAAANGATFYRLLERTTPNAAYAQLGADIAGTSTSRTMPLHRRFGASYILEACNKEGCTDSAPVDVVDSMAAAVGYFKASNTSEMDGFGEVVALSADGNTLAVGASGEDSASGIDGDQGDNSAPGAGAVYVFKRVGEAWMQQAYVKVSNTPGDSFGISIALSADGNTLAVGAQREDSSATGVNGNQSDNSATSAGAVYVFKRADDAWSQQAYVKASNTEGGDQFGVAVALSADGNTLAVGADGEDSNAKGIGGNQGDNTAVYSGAVYVFKRTVDTWSQQAYIKASNAGMWDYFGTGIALSADGSTLAVGAYAEASSAKGIGGDQVDNSADSAGAAYVFKRAGEAWTQQAYVKASNTGIGDYFGYSVALSADGDTLAIGAFYENSSATGIGGDQSDLGSPRAGAVYVFKRTVGVWSQQAYVKASNTEADDNFGYSLALSADGDILAVGAPGEDSKATGMGGDQDDNASSVSGAVYVLGRTGVDWSQQAYAKASNTGAFDSCNFSVALSSDGDTLVVGACSENSKATGIGGEQTDNTLVNAGAVYVY